MFSHLQDTKCIHLQLLMWCLSYQQIITIKNTICVIGWKHLKSFRFYTIKKYIQLYRFQSLGLILIAFRYFAIQLKISFNTIQIIFHNLAHLCSSGLLQSCATIRSDPSRHNPRWNLKVYLLRQNVLFLFTGQETSKTFW